MPAQIGKLGKALSSPERVEILRMLYNHHYIIGDIARELGLPVSGTVFYLKILEEAGLISMQPQPGTRGNTKICTSIADYVNIELVAPCAEATEIFSVEMPIGAFTSCHVTQTCGLVSKEGRIGIWDMENSFFIWKESMQVFFGRRPGMWSINLQMGCKRRGQPNRFLFPWKSVLKRQSIRTIGR